MLRTATYAIATAAGLLVLCACTSLRGRGASEAREPVARSLLGQQLYALPVPEDRRPALEADLAAAHAAWLIDPTGEEPTIWYGRRLAYLGRYQEAIDVYTEGLQHHPRSAALLRHRGHRFLTLRQLGPALLDLERARSLLVDAPDVVEPDGQPNEHGIPRSTLKTNVWYHLGLAYFLEGNFPVAMSIYREGLELSRINDDMFVATAYWLYQSLRRVGYRREAQELLGAISTDMEILENHAYHRLLLLYRGDLTLEDVAPGGTDDGVEDATLGFGIASYHLFRGDQDALAAALLAVISGESWPAFGHIAAEAELMRIGPFLAGSQSSAR